MAGGTLVGRELAGYRIDAVIGRGGMGVCYRAFDPELQRPVALKVIAPELAQDPAFKERFLREIEVAASLEHPHVCPVYRAGEEAGELYLCMRLLEAGSLAARVSAQGPYLAEQALALVTQLASALDLAHARGLLHRDVKPENVLLDHEGNAYLVDFGLARAIWADDEEVLFAGTLAYLAPERCQGAPALAASDQYALACLFHFLLTGSPPFSAEHEAALVYAQLRSQPPSLTEHGLGRLDPVLAQALAKDPGERFTSCSAFAGALGEALARPERPGGEDWPASLPRPATRLVGRSRELRELEALLADRRLVTLTGPGGTGKTRLALQVAAETASTYPDGVVWVSLAPLRDPAYLLPQIAQALALSESPQQSLRETLHESLAGKRALVCLDNCEHLLPEIASEIAQLRDLAGGPSLLCTSRERLDLQAEQLYPVGSLADKEAVELFCERARALDPSFAADDPAIAALCARLDSLPLALELAAARTSLFTCAELLARLAEHLDLLKGSREHDPRHRTLSATIDWSYALLEEDEQRALRAFSVFAGGATAQAAAEVAGADPDTLHSLISKSLLRTRESPAGRRYWMLETIRQYAAERLAQAGEEEGVRGRHLEYVVDLATRAEPLLEGADVTNAVAALEDESANIRTALLGAVEAQPGPALEIIAALRRFWIHGGSGSQEAYDVLTEVLDARPDVPAELRTRALITTSSLCLRHGNYGDARLPLEEAVALARGIGDARLLARALNAHGLIAYRTGVHEVAESSWIESMELDRESGDQLPYAKTLSNLGALYRDKGDLEASRSLQEEALVALRAADRPIEMAISLENLSRVVLELGDNHMARMHALEALEITEAHHEPFLVIHAHTLLAEIALAEADTSAAGAHLFAAVELCDIHTDAMALWDFLETCAELGYAEGAFDAAVQIFGAAEALAAGRWSGQKGSNVRDTTLSEIENRIGRDRVERGLSAGRAFSMEQALTSARSLLRKQS